MGYLKYILRVSRFYFTSNKKYRENKFKRDFGYYPDLYNPITFNEKIFRRMVMPVDEQEMTRLADKLQARTRVEKIDGRLLPTLYGVFNNVDDIALHQFPDKFVLKCNHDSGSYVICTDKNSFDLDKAKEKLSRHLRMNMYYKTREWQYKNIQPCILCEEYIDTSSAEYFGFYSEIYRIHCFSANPVYIEVEYRDADSNQYTNIYDADWNVQPVQINERENTPLSIPCPDEFSRMLFLARQLSHGFDYCRVDMYLTKDQIYFSEFTFSPNNGREKFLPRYWDVVFGVCWNDATGSGRIAAAGK
ncbi:ATP-grasp fold amidoligase family protein [Erwinia typographi]|uniref:ATP-grasp fold amidoligase family protein n=1 Tax=Erwinia typographi TaxID=371042 RepID=UPI00068F17AA|nr:ATP-grasp fold amidoligase family protein [Erwinia typographi]